MQLDGTRVATVGFPAPTITNFTLDSQGNYLTGSFFLKSHANEGIVSAQYLENGIYLYELNVGWHNGESGGPITTISNTPSVFSIMQHYRNIESMHGILPGPHRGSALSTIIQELITLGITK